MGGHKEHAPSFGHGMPLLQMMMKVTKPPDDSITIAPVQLTPDARDGYCYCYCWKQKLNAAAHALHYWSG
jgi:hypothetical protein